MPVTRKPKLSLKTAEPVQKPRDRQTRKDETHPHLVSQLGWTCEQAAQVRASLQAFDSDWDAPGMEAYDRL